MSSNRFVSVKFSPIGRAQTFLLNDLLFADVPLPGQPVWSGLVAGDQVVVQSEAGTAVGSIVPMPSTVMERRQLPEHSPNRVLRRATLEDVTETKRFWTYVIRVGPTPTRRA